MPVRLQQVEDMEVYDVVSDIEKAFDLTFARDAFFEDERVGQVFDTVWNALSPKITKGGKCPTLLTFAIVKTWLRDQGYCGKTAPNTILADIPGFNYARMQDHFRKGGWVMPARAVQPATWMISVALTVAIHLYILPVLGQWTVLTAPFCAYCIGLALHRVVFRQGGSEAVTAGELARLICYANMRRLRDMGGTFNRKTLWGKFQQYLADPQPNGAKLARDSLLVSDL